MSCWYHQRSRSLWRCTRWGRDAVHRHRGGFVEIRLQICLGRRQGIGNLCLQNLAQLVQHFGRRLFQETGCKLVQQTPDLFGGSHEGLRLLLRSTRLQLHMLKSMLQHSGEIRQSRKSHSGRAAGQRMRKRNRVVRQVFVQFE